jgi:hypothetical protein
MIAAKNVEAPIAPSDVSEFAARNGLTSLHSIVSLTHDEFPGCSVTVRLERDAEIEAEQYVVIDVDVTGWAVDRMFAGRNLWSQEFGRACPPAERHLFQIRLVQNP